MRRHWIIIVLLALLTPLSVCVSPVGLVRAFQSQPTESEQTTGTSSSSDVAAWQRREEAALEDHKVTILQRLPAQTRWLSSLTPHGLPGALPVSGHRLANGLNAPLRT